MGTTQIIKADECGEVLIQASLLDGHPLFGGLAIHSDNMNNMMNNKNNIYIYI